MSGVEWGPGIWSYRHHCRAREQGYSELIEYRNEFLTELMSFSLGSKGLKNHKHWNLSNWNGNDIFCIHSYNMHRLTAEMSLWSSRTAI